MKTHYVPLINKPCPVSWDTMQGDEKRRFCQHCQLHVHNLSAMTTDEQVAVLKAPGDRKCVTYTAPANAKPVDASVWVATQTASGWRKALAAMLAAAFSLFATSCRTMGGIPPPPPPPTTAESVEAKTPVSHTDQQPSEFSGKGPVPGGIVCTPPSWWRRLLFLD